jgi:hypothetical protein
MRTLSANPSQAREATERVIAPHPFGDAILALGAPARTAPLWRQLAPGAVGLIAAIFLVGQVRKPGRWAGRPFLWAMNLSHSGLTAWGDDDT